ncbi:hypothetical protein HZS_5512 [Henneguya salminicola]|nr:hypothetical protein HZS_5512 [Henneguya salminicola]
MKFFERYFNYGKLNLPYVIEKNLESKNFLISYDSKENYLTLLSNIEKNDLFAIEMNKITEMFSVVSNTLEILSDILTRKFSILNKLLNQPCIMIKDEMAWSLLYCFVGTILCLRAPYQALREDVPGMIWKTATHPIITKLKNLIDFFPSASEIQLKKCIFFHAILHCIQTIKKSLVPQKNIKFILYFISYYSCVIGDMQKYITPTIPDLDLEFYIFATKIWPRYCRPFQCLALAYQQKDMLFETTYYYTRSFLCMTGADRFSTARQDLGTIYESVVSQSIKWEDKMKNSKDMENINLLTASDVEPFIFSVRDVQYLFALKNHQKATLIVDYCHAYLKFNVINDLKILKDRYKIVFNNFIFSFLLLNMQIINKYNLDKFETALNQWLMLFECLKQFDDFFIPYIFDSFPCFALIMIYSLEINVYDTQDLTASLSIQSSFKMIICFTNQIVKLLKIVSNESLLSPMLKFISLIFRCIDRFIDVTSLQEAIMNTLIRGDLFLLVDLYSFINTNINEYTEILILPDFKMFANSSLGIECDSKYWDQLDYIDNQTPKNIYIQYIWQCLNKIIKNHTLFFKINENVCQFYEASFIAKQETSNIALKFKHFVPRLRGIREDRLLYNYVLNINKSKEPVIYFIRYIIPDTNTFLMENNSIITSGIFYDADIVVPILGKIYL